MREALQALIASYTAELEYYRIGGGETSLQRAYELGRQAITAGMGLLDMAAVHHQALLTILLGIPTPAEIVQVTQEADAFFTESLGSFEMSLRGFRQANATLRHLNETLEARVSALVAQVVQSEKLAAMGSLLAGVAHELNNPLSVVLCRAALIRMKVGDTPLGAQVEQIELAAERCARIVRNFLALARQRPPERQDVRLNQVVREAVELLAYPLRVDTVEVTLDLDATLPLLWADPNQLHQVVVNFVTNAHQALRETPPPRRLILTTRVDPAHSRVVLEVADTGPGIPPAIQARLFEPFFTTKPPGSGTGLGLSLCLGIIEEHRGTIRVESTPGHGALFRIELPVDARDVTVSQSPTAEALSPIRGQRILVVDDEPEIASMLADLLVTDGHQVETATNGAHALEKLRDGGYDLILSDLRMPTLDGPGLYQALQRSQPAFCQRLIFLTGDTLSPETRAFLEQTGIPTVHKPFTLDEVREVVQRVAAARQL